LKIKIAGAGIIGQALKCFKNGHTRKEKGQGNKWLGFGSRRAKKQA
jgi:hypothetical protein